jgi:hypothetical protein
VKGEGLLSEASILGSGAHRLLGFFASTGGFTGTLGLAARLTLGGPCVVSDLASLLGLLLGIGGGAVLSATGGFGKSAGCRNALIRASSAGVVVLLMTLACPLLADSPVLSGVRGAMKVPPAEGRKSSEKALWGDRGGLTLTVGGDEFVGVKDDMDTGRSPAVPAGVCGLCGLGDGASRDCPLGVDRVPISALLPAASSVLSRAVGECPPGLSKEAGGFAPTGVAGVASGSFAIFSNLARSDDMRLIEVVSGPSCLPSPSMVMRSGGSGSGCSTASGRVVQAHAWSEHAQEAIGSKSVAM